MFMIKSIILGVLMLCNVAYVRGGCREQEDRCPPVCVLDPITNKYSCQLRAVLIFTNSSLFDAALPKMQVVWEMAQKRVRELELLPPELEIVSKFYDDRCDQSRALIDAMDGSFRDCADVIFGPVCDYALATVARLTKYLHRDGTPMLTPGGNSYEYLERKTTCNDEFYMLTRTGFLNYKPMAQFTVELFKRYNWKKVVYLYERDGQYSVGGQKTCHLTMSTIAKFHKLNNISFHPYSADRFENLTETLRREVAYDKSSK